MHVKKLIQMQLHTAGLLVIKNKKLLLAFSKNKQCFYLPGGKIDPGESSALALCREIKEELNIILQETELEYYTHISAPAYGEAAGIIMEQDCFLLRREIQPEASAEIDALQYFSLKGYLQQEYQAPGAIVILQQLTTARLIDE
jgi:8-oxo-dGTP pyrophosphatase MutT (NUDIX family)